MATRLRNAFIAASVGWAALLVAAPFFASRAHASALTGALIVGVYGIGSLVCHQRPERSYHMWAAQMPVCARCAGIYLGGVVGVLAALWRSGRPWAARWTRTLRRDGVRVALALAVAPTLASLGYEWTTGGMPSHAIRAAAGVPLGLVVAWLVVAAADNQVN
jgi:Predicted membrane protein (DUF2085)